MEVNESFCTEGDLLFTSDPGAPNCTSVIIVHPGKYAKFKAGECP